MKSRNDESYMFHVPNIHVTDLLAEALEIPIMSVETDGIKEEELEDLKLAFENTEIELCVPPFKYCTDNATMIACAAYPYS